MPFKAFVPKCPECGATIFVEPDDCPQCNRKVALDELRYLLSLRSGINRNVVTVNACGRRKIKRVRTS